MYSIMGLYTAATTEFVKTKGKRCKIRRRFRLSKTRHLYLHRNVILHKKKGPPHWTILHDLYVTQTPGLSAPLSL